MVKQEEKRKVSCLKKGVLYEKADFGCPAYGSGIRLKFMRKHEIIGHGDRE
jgi:hypothetical protein